MQLLGIAEGERMRGLWLSRSNGTPGNQRNTWCWLASQAEILGRIRESRALRQHVADLAKLRNLNDAAVRILRPDASWDALLRNCETAGAAEALSDVILAMCGNEALVRRAEEQNQHWTPNAYSNPAQIPLTHAAAEFGLGHMAEALKQLQAAAPYDRAYPFANYLRGLVYLRLRKGPEAAVEFQKVLDHPGNNWAQYYLLSYAGLAIAAILTGERPRALRAYRALQNLWRDADPDIPLVNDIRKEYASLNR